MNETCCDLQLKSKVKRAYSAAGSAALIRLEDALAGMRVATLTIGIPCLNEADKFANTIIEGEIE